MRSGPSTSSPQVALVPEGGKVVVLKDYYAENSSRKKPLWTPARYGPTIGWVYIGYLWPGDHSRTVADKRRIASETRRNARKLGTGDLSPCPIPSLNALTFDAMHVFETCFTDTCRWTESLTFKSGNVRYVRKGTCYGDREKASQEGTYRIHGEKLLITLGTGESLSVGPDRKRIKHAMKPRVMVLQYCRYLDALVEERTLAELEGAEIVFDRKSRYIAGMADEYNYRLCRAGNRFSDYYHLRGIFTRRGGLQGKPFPGL